MSSSRILIRGAVLALIAAVLAFVGGALGIDTLWPVLLAAAVGVAAATPLSVGRAGAFVAGAVVGWVALALRAGMLPDTAASKAIVVVLAIALLTAMAAATADVVPLWTGLVGYAAFAGYYEPIFAADPTSFVADSATAMVTVLMAAALGFIAALLGDLIASMLSGGSSSEVVEPRVADEEVVR